MSTTAPEWIKTSTQEELREAALWFQEDAAYTYRKACEYRDSGAYAGPWIATRVQESAAHSSGMARLIVEELTQ